MYIRHVMEIMCSLQLGPLVKVKSCVVPRNGPSAVSKTKPKPLHLLTSPRATFSKAENHLL